MIQEPGKTPRRFIRHTVDVPLEVTPAGASPNAHSAKDTGVNVSHGGLAFVTDECLDIGDVVNVKVPTVDPPFEARARVIWCREERSRFLVGVAFLDAADAFRSRMVEQVCSIESYRRRVFEEEGRALDAHEAGLEWIARYAGRFPDASE